MPLTKALMRFLTRTTIMMMMTALTKTWKASSLLGKTIRARGLLRRDITP